MTDWGESKAMSLFGPAMILLTLLSSPSFSQELPGSRAHPGDASVAPAAAFERTAVGATGIATLHESFEDVGTLAAAGWSVQNLSTPLGSLTWFQGTPTSSGGPFDAFNGAPGAYVGVNYQSVSNNGTISNWLITPELEFGGSSSLSFYTRKSAPDTYADRLEVRISTSGSSTDTGATASSTGAFGTLLLSINPSLNLGVYPTTWTRYTITNDGGLPRSGSGRIAFRYFVTNGGQVGANSDYIGIDEVNFIAGQPEYPLGGTIIGLTGSGLSISLNGGAAMAVAANSTSFAFPGLIQAGSNYAVTIATQPTDPSQSCGIANDTGIVSGAVTNVTIFCSTNTYSVSGAVSGLAGSGLALQLNGAGTLGIVQNGGYAFPPMPDQSGYTVSVLQQPANPAQTCTVSHAAGTIDGANVPNVDVSCVTNSFSIGGTVSGVAGSGIRLQLNGGEELAIAQDGPYEFAAVPDLSDYVVIVTGQPSMPSQTCVLGNSSGTLAGANVANLDVVCQTDDFNILADVSGLVGTGLVLQLNGAPSPIASYGNNLLGVLPDLSDFTVTILTQPSAPAQTCTIVEGTGTLAGQPVVVPVSCVTESFALSISGGSGQSAALGAPFDDLLIITLRDGDLAPVEFATVTFQAPATGASALLSDGVQPAAAVLDVSTDATGVAIVAAEANAVPGCYLVVASSDGANVPVVLALTNIDTTPEVFADGFEVVAPVGKGASGCQ